MERLSKTAPVGETGVVLEVRADGRYRLDFPDGLDTDAEESWSDPPAELFSFELVLRPEWHVAVGFSEIPVTVEVNQAGSTTWVPGETVQIGSIWACPRRAGDVTLRISNGVDEICEHRPVRDRRQAT